MATTLDKAAQRLLCETAPSRVADAAERLAGDEVAEIDASLPGALAGDRELVRLYVSAYGRLTDRMLEALGGACPDLVGLDEEHHVVWVGEVKSAAAPARRQVPWLKAVLRGQAMSAPFTPWVAGLDCGRGTAVAMVHLLRQTLATGRPLSPPARRGLPVWDLGEEDVVRFYRAVTSVLEDAELPLERIQEGFALNRTEAAELFGVRRQALEGWERNGVPAERQAKLARVGAILDLLSTRLKADRIAAVARRPAPAYGDRSILGAIAAGAEEQVLERLRAGFDWAAAA